MEGPEVIDPHQLGGHLRRREQESIHRGDARVVDEQVDRRSVRRDGRDRRTDRRRVAHVDGMRDEAGRRPAIGFAREPMHGPALGEQPLGQGAA